jgi:hypothetical protein
LLKFLNLSHLDLNEIIITILNAFTDHSCFNVQLENLAINDIAVFAVKAIYLHRHIIHTCICLDL